MDGQSPYAGGKLSVTAVWYQITDTGSSLEGHGRKGVCYQLVALAAATDCPIRWLDTESHYAV